ncbi:MAG TPA: DUF4412 domain-containing protein [Chitinophagales bacterium]|nr:DUF4412 domain-containing protein [Chitinophagales bacterium]
MKNFLLLFTIVMSTLLSAAQSFEGMVTMVPDFKTKPDTKNQMVFYVKGDKVAMEPNGTGPMNGRIVGSSATKEYYMLVDADGKKIALNMNMDKMVGMYGGGNPALGKGKPDDHPVKPTVTETGETRVIDGYTCRQVLAEMNGEKSEFWITKDIDLSLGNLLFSPNVGTQFKNYGDLQGMVLEAWHYDSKGKITSSMKMTPVKKSVDDKMFEIPEGYEKMDMMQLMQAAQGNQEMMQLMQKMFGGQK